jgi:hypothetical protein
MEVGEEAEAEPPAATEAVPAPKAAPAAPAAAATPAEELGAEEAPELDFEEAEEQVRASVV